MLKYILWLTLLCSPSLFATENTAATADAYGAITADSLLQQYPSFAAEFAAFTPSAQDISAMQRLHDVSLVVLFGSWCHDSEREVSRLLKLIQVSGVELASLQLHAVDRNKQHPENLQTQFELRFTPTIIVLRDGKELGRIIEKPQQSLAADLAELAKR